MEKLFEFDLEDAVQGKQHAAPKTNNKKINSLYILSIPCLLRKSQVILTIEINSEYTMKLREKKSENTDIVK